MQLMDGYKQTVVGVIPVGWEVKPFGEIGKLSKGKGLLKGDIKLSGDIPSIPYTALYTDYSEVVDYSLIKWFIDDENQSVIVIEPCLLLASSSNMEANTGKASALPGGTAVAIGREVIVFKTSADCVYLSYLLSTRFYRKKTLALSRGTTIKHVYPATFQDYLVAYPSIREQNSIATTLSDVDALLGGLDRLIAKKRDIKLAAMQQLLTGQTRLPGFSGEWAVKLVGDVADCLDNLRIPLNEAQRALRFGEFPYCGANGVLGFVDDFLIDDDIILLAEDGGYFDEFETRPIAYRIRGKCWVNNHAHILKAKSGFNQDFLFYSLVHKNILPFLASGTRAKLNKAEMNKIEVDLPLALAEQVSISSVLAEMDAELAALDARRNKTNALKQAMMQELLTGRIRLVDAEPKAELQT